MTAILPQIKSLLQPQETSTPAYEEKLEFLRQLGVLANALENDAQQRNFVAVQLLSEKLDALVAAKRISHYMIHGWRDNEILVNIFMSDELYTRRRRMNIQRELEASVSATDFYVDATILTDVSNGKSPQSYQ